MSRARLHDQLTKLFEVREPALLLECLNHSDFQKFMEAHGLEFALSELVVAFTHTSFAHEYDVAHQEKLEFLGDAVLQLILTEELFAKLPRESEGRLSKLRATIVNEKSLAEIAKFLGLGDLLLVGKGEHQKKLFLQETVLADTLEALLAQIYRRQGFGKVRELFLAWLGQVHPNAYDLSGLEASDPKSTLQEKSLAKYKKLPHYTAEPEGDQFLVKLWLNGELVASGVFPSKKGGEKELASSVLKQGLL